MFEKVESNLFENGDSQAASKSSPKFASNVQADDASANNTTDQNMKENNEFHTLIHESTEITSRFRRDQTNKSNAFDMLIFKTECENSYCAFGNKTIPQPQQTGCALAADLFAVQSTGQSSLRKIDN